MSNPNASPRDLMAIGLIRLLIRTNNPGDAQIAKDLCKKLHISTLQASNEGREIDMRDLNYEL